jgi:hypothetical protein
MLTLHIVPYDEIADLTSIGRIRKLLNLAKEDKIVLLEGKLRKEEEAELIQATMEEINKDFRGIELATIDVISKNSDGFAKFKSAVASVILGDRQGLTVIGPANVVKAIKKDPHKIELLAREGARKKRR